MVFKEPLIVACIFSCHCLYNLPNSFILEQKSRTTGLKPFMVNEYLKMSNTKFQVVVFSWRPRRTKYVGWQPTVWNKELLKIHHTLHFDGFATACYYGSFLQACQQKQLPLCCRGSRGIIKKGSTVHYLTDTTHFRTWQGLSSVRLIWRVTGTGGCNSPPPPPALPKLLFTLLRHLRLKICCKMPSVTFYFSLSLLYSLHIELAKRWHNKTHFLRRGDKYHCCSNWMFHQPLE